jgi:hypothetical protein
MVDVSFYTDRELIHERFNWRSFDHLVSSHRELERRGYVVEQDGVLRSEDNLLGQEGLRRRKEYREGSCGLQTCSVEMF